MAVGQAFPKYQSRECSLPDSFPWRAAAKAHQTPDRDRFLRQRAPRTLRVVIRNYLMASLRNLARNKLHSAISLFGLAMRLCGATLAGVLLHSELSYDRFIPGYERVYLGEWTMAPAGHPIGYKILSPNWLASQMRLRFGEIQAITRIAEQV